MVSSSMTRRIQLNISKMGGGSKKVAEFVLSQPEDVAMLAAARVADTLGLSESTVVRFANILGFSTYAEFRRELQVDVRRQLAPGQRLERSSANPVRDNNAARRLLESDIACLERSIHLLSDLDLERAVEMIIAAHHVYVLGLRASFGVAHLGYFQLHQVMNNISLVDTSYGDALDSLRSIGEEDLLITVSFPRHTMLVVDACGFAKSKGAQLLSVTDSPLSPTAEKADLTLSVETSVEGVTTSLTSAMALVNAIANQVSFVASEKSAASLENYEVMLRAGKVFPDPS